MVIRRMIIVFIGLFTGIEGQVIVRFSFIAFSRIAYRSHFYRNASCMNSRGTNSATPDRFGDRK